MSDDTVIRGNMRQRARWWIQRRRKAYLRPVYSNGQQPFPSCVHRWRTEDRRPRGHKFSRKLKHLARRKRWYVNVICTRCRSVRCGDSTDQDPCLLHRHHHGAHDMADPK